MVAVCYKYKCLRIWIRSGLDLFGRSRTFRNGSEATKMFILILYRKVQYFVLTVKSNRY
jgi:hypothetical protein